jgi:hypothetical protein
MPRTSRVRIATRSSEQLQGIGAGSDQAPRSGRDERGGRECSMAVDSGAPSGADSNRSSGSSPRPGQDPYDTIEWVQRTSRITNPDGSVVFEMETPRSRRAGRRSPPTSWSRSTSARPAFRSTTSTATRSSMKTVSRCSARAQREAGDQPAGRHLAPLGREARLLRLPEDAQAFEDELKYMLVHQMAAPNSPQWFNTGLSHAYGITGPAQGHTYVDPETDQVVRSKPTPIPARPRTPASFSRSRTIWSTRAASSIWRPARRASSSTAPVQGAISLDFAAKVNRSPAAARHPA